MLETHRRLYNACLGQRKSVYEKDQISVSYYEQSAWYKNQRAVNPWFAKLNFSSAQGTMRLRACVSFHRRTALLSAICARQPECLIRGVGYAAFSPRPVAEWISADTSLLKDICFPPTPRDVRRPPLPTRYVVSLRTGHVASSFFTIDGPRADVGLPEGTHCRRSPRTRRIQLKIR